MHFLLTMTDELSFDAFSSRKEGKEAERANKTISNKIFDGGEVF